MMERPRDYHICGSCEHCHDEMREYGFMDASNIYNDCDYYWGRVEEYFDNPPTMIFFRRSPERNEVYVTVCPGFQSLNYSRYMSSDLWKQKRLARIEKDGYKCKLCGSAINLNVHHITYERLGREPLDDLITVCADCHEKLHEKDLAHE